MSEFLFLPFRQSGNIHRIASTHNLSPILPPGHWHEFTLIRLYLDLPSIIISPEQWTISPARCIYSSMH